MVSFELAEIKQYIYRILDTFLEASEMRHPAWRTFAFGLGGLRCGLSQAQQLGVQLRYTGSRQRLPGLLGGQNIATLCFSLLIANAVMRLLRGTEQMMKQSSAALRRLHDSLDVGREVRIYIYGTDHWKGQNGTQDVKPFYPHG